MRLFWELVQRSFQRQMTYRAAIFAGLFTNFFFGLFRVAILLALLGDSEAASGYGAEDLITYAAMTQAVIGMLMMFGWYDLMTAVYTGDISSDLLKPMPIFTFWLAQDLGRALVDLLLRGVSFMLLFEIIYDLTYPKTAVQWLIVAIALIFSWLISFAWRFLINLAAFWSPQAKGYMRFGFMMVWFFSGFLMPIPLYPEWVQQVAYATPFPYLLDMPVQLFLGIPQTRSMLSLFMTQAAWAIGLILLCQVTLRRGFRRLVILGG